MALHNLDLNSDLIYHSQGSKNGRQEWATKRYGTKEILKMMRKLTQGQRQGRGCILKGAL